jgi:hypothetical protein
VKESGNAVLDSRRVADGRQLHDILRGLYTRELRRALDYKPDPIDTSRVVLGSELKALTERLSQNAHDVWARQRLADGWRWGPERNDARKEHPGLIAYDRLTDSEKELDRKTAMETLRAILALGFRILPPESRAP